MAISYSGNIIREPGFDFFEVWKTLVRTNGEFFCDTFSR